MTAINSEVKKKFPERSFPDIEANLGEQDIIAYAYLAKNFQYPMQFKVDENFRFKNFTVKGFRTSN